MNLPLWTLQEFISDCRKCVRPLKGVWADKAFAAIANPAMQSQDTDMSKTWEAMRKEGKSWRIRQSSKFESWGHFSWKGNTFIIPQLLHESGTHLKSHGCES